MLKPNKIHQGDCLELMKEIPDKSVDMILCDLPYGTTVCKWDVIIPFDKLWEQYNRIIKDRGAIILTASQPFTTALISSNTGCFRYVWIWNKLRGVGHLNAKKRPLMITEEICVFYKSIGIYNPQMRPRGIPRKSKNITQSNVYGRTQKIFEGEILKQKYPINLIEFSKSGPDDYLLHPTQKPAALFEYLIKTYTNEGDVVLDNCIGSGTTAVACLNTGRNFIGIELEEKYVDIARKRIAERQMALSK